MRGIVWLRHKKANRLKTASAPPVGLPDALVAALSEWRRDKTCGWVFPNSSGKPWATSGPGYKHLDQLKALAARAGIAQATWKMFRHAFSTHGKQRFGPNDEGFAPGNGVFGSVRSRTGTPRATRPDSR